MEFDMLTAIMWGMGLSVGAAIGYILITVILAIYVLLVFRY